MILEDIDKAMVMIRLQNGVDSEIERFNDFTRIIPVECISFCYHGKF